MRTVERTGTRTAPSTRSRSWAARSSCTARRPGAVEALAYLRQKDDALAGKYLEATAQYLEMYRGLIGPYPYGKFALVENFWETGYGMPSYTLLGPQVIRFPFILTSSYPHEILHNWWGNSVFVDYATGNWCEGLTAYMADHLIQEQRGRGEEYRRDTLQKYRSYVKDGRDFALTEFRSRHSAATEAIGYGKTLMLFHMLRQRLGDDGFRQWAARFYRENKGRQASFSDIRKGMEAVAKQDLGRLFADHVERPGAAVLRVSGAAVRATSGGGYEVTGTSSRRRPARRSRSTCRWSCRRPARQRARPCGSRRPQTAFTVTTEALPLALHVDPSFDVFRLLDPRETPASIGQIFGEPKILAVLPAQAPAAEQAAYRALVEGWRSDSHQPEIRTDAEVRELPKDRAVWILGRGNALASRLFASGADYTLDGQKLTVDRETMPLARHVGVIVRRHPGEPREGGGLHLRRRRRGIAGPRPQAAALRQVLVPRLRGRRAGERPQGSVDGHRFAAAGRPAARGRANGGCGGARAPAANGARGAPARLLAEGAPRARDVALGAGAGGPGPRHEGPRGRRRVRRGAVQGDRAPAGRGRRLLLPVLHGDSLALGSSGSPAQRDRRAAGHEARMGWTVGSAHRPLRPPRPRLAGRAQGRRGEAPPGRRRQRERCRRAARARQGDRLRREAAAHARLRRVRRRGGGAPRLAPLRRASAVPAREDDGRDQPRHGRPTLRPEALGARDGQRLGVAAHLPRRRLRHGRRGPDDPGRPRVLRPEELHRQGRARGAGLHRPAPRLPPARRHRRQDRRPRAREGGDAT